MTKADRAAGAADLAIGVFDGVHRGHQYLIEQMVAHARSIGHASVCVTFDPDPEVVLHPERSLYSLSSVEERTRRLQGLGIEQVDVLPFTPQVARQSALEFVSGLQRAYSLHALWVGSDFALGRDRMGTVDRLEAIGRERGFEVVAVEPLRDGSRALSSTWIRELLREGDVRGAAQLLGRPFGLEGTVIEGARRGQQLGFPTANLRPPPGRALPADGVYVIQAQVSGTAWVGVANLGARPTFGESERLLEAHLIDFAGDLYGSLLEVCFLERLREVRRFNSLEELQAQLKEDVAAARARPAVADRAS